jgi:hypothetical protein
MDRVSFFRLLGAGALALLLIAGAGWTAAHAQDAPASGPVAAAGHA